MSKRKDLDSDVNDLIDESLNENSSDTIENDKATHKFGEHPYYSFCRSHQQYS
jgi:hypothetical protein